MANYLPMLLVSVTTNAVPDDTSLSTQPRGQVDYLSHEWQEEDVWRSWRNMTRQKNEIANGVRLENASWRTWWKQRNKLKTISPETLNWLKDSDVTWLYGPLHTAVDWSPPPKTESSSGSSAIKDYFDDQHAREPSAPADIRLANLSPPPGKKPILKHRSISELLTSALPSFTHTAADEAYLDEDVDEDDDTEGDGHYDYEDESGEREGAEGGKRRHRPPLKQTKSDTNITSWARSHHHPFRKTSPPRIIAPVSPNATITQSFPSSSSSTVTHSPSILSGNLAALPSAPALDHRSGSSDTSASRSSQELGAPSIASANNEGKKKHITFNTFVEQFIAIDSPPSKPADEGDFERKRQKLVYERDSDDGYDEDTEVSHHEPADDQEELDGIFAVAPPSRRSASPELDLISNPNSTSASTSNSDDNSDDDDDILEMRPRSRSSSHSHHVPSGAFPPTPYHSHAHAPYPHHPHAPFPPASQRRSFYGSRPPLVRTMSNDKEKSHVTIAPIAPTLLKTHGGDREEDEDDEDGTFGGVDHQMPFGFYDYGSSSGDGYDQGVYSCRRERTTKRGSASPPVNLVYVPSGYAIAAPGISRSRSGSSEDVYRHREAHFSVGSGSGSRSPIEPDQVPSAEALPLPAVESTVHNVYTAELVVQTPDADGMQEATIDYFGEQVGYMPSPLGRESNTENVIVRVDAAEGEDGRKPAEERVSRSRSRSRTRSRSRSHSRTPSPAEMALHQGPSIDAPLSASLPIARSASHDSTLLSPPPRGRAPGPVSASYSGPASPAAVQGRGRSSTRGGSFSSERERSTGSPLGSVSPSGSAAGLVGAGSHSVYAQARGRRGREGKRTGSSDSWTSNASTSPPLPRHEVPSSPVVSSVSPAASGSEHQSSDLASSSRGRAPHKPTLSLPLEIPPSIEEEEEQARSAHPTPSNSPVAVKALQAVLKDAPRSPPSSSPDKGKSRAVDCELANAWSRSPASPRSPEREGGLVSRAADIVSSSARGLWGALWPGSPTGSGSAGVGFAGGGA